METASKPATGGMKGQYVLLLAIPLLALVMMVAAWIFRGGREDSIRRERDEIERLVRDQRHDRSIDPVTAIGNLRKVQGSTGAAAPRTPVDARAAREDLVKLGDTALPAIRKAFSDPQETALFRLELVAVAGDMKGTEAESFLLSVLADRTLEERFRTLALARTAGRTSDAVFEALRKIYLEEQDFAARNLVLRAIGEIPGGEATAILIDASQKEKGASARIQAVDSLGKRMRESRVLDGVLEVLRQDPQENVRLAAIASLGKSDDPSAEQALREIVESPQSSPSLRKAAQNQLAARNTK